MSFSRLPSSHNLQIVYIYIFYKVYILVVKKVVGTMKDTHWEEVIKEVEAPRNVHPETRKKFMFL